MKDQAVRLVEVVVKKGHNLFYFQIEFFNLEILTLQKNK